LALFYLLYVEGSSATDFVADVADVTDVRDGSAIEVGRRKKEEGRKNIVEKRRGL
jgi:hypothetical protein